jgi:hypothetical protein
VFSKKALFIIVNEIRAGAIKETYDISVFRYLILPTMAPRPKPKANI